MAYTTIDDPSAYFQIALYNGSASSVTVTNDGNSDLQPDWLWFKKRNTTGDHNTFDTSRGLTERLFPNLTSQSDTTDPNGISSLTDGFTTGTSYGDVNGAGNTFVTWQWKANGGSRTTFTESGANPGGGYQANTTAGFSIVDYTGTGTNGGTVAHGLGATPTIAIIKDRDTVGTNWIVAYTIQDGSSDRLYLQDTNSKFDLPDGSTEFRVDFSSSNITLGTWNNINADGKKFIAYVFTPIQGYSKFGSYTGNGSLDGPFVYLGFKPAWVLIKQTSTAQNWILYDNKINPFNEAVTKLSPNLSDAEDSSTGNNDIDMLSNGFKVTEDNNDMNESGQNFIYMAFAESPFVSSEGVPTTAR
jgi:hypothetical protein